MRLRSESVWCVDINYPVVRFAFLHVRGDVSPESKASWQLGVPLVFVVAVHAYRCLLISATALKMHLWTQ